MCARSHIPTQAGHPRLQALKFSQPAAVYNIRTELESPVTVSLNLTATTATTAATLAANAVQQAPAADLATFPTSITRSQSPESDTRLQQYLQALAAPLKMGQAASGVADALVSTMQSIVTQRPDLSNASFDFKLNHGALEVVSDSLSSADKQWVQDKLNANTSLVDAAKQFHDDAVDGYSQWATASGEPLTADQSAAVSTKADNLTGFLTLFSKLGDDATKGMFSDGAYQAPDGTNVSFGQDATTAAGFLSFKKSADTLADGTATWVAPDGRAHTGVLKSDIFANDRIVPNFFPEIETVGLSKMV